MDEIVKLRPYVGARGPRPPLEGDALRFAVDCATLANAPLSTLETPALRALGVRYAARVGIPPSAVARGPIPANIQGSLARFRRFLLQHVIARMDHPGGFEVERGVAVQLFEGLLATKLAASMPGRPYVVEPDAPWDFSGDQPSSKPEGAFRATEPAEAIYGLILASRYWPFGRCRNSECRLIFVPNKRAQDYCTDKCRKAVWHRENIKADERRREEARTVAKRHRRAKKRSIRASAQKPSEKRSRRGESS